ncbi:MAG: MFS transporter [archaeon GB-1867-035]|nr:MFS transporter [Candidatus Culexmicrobium profundum]
MKSITLTKNKQKRIHISDLNIIIIGNPLLPLFASIFTASLAANALFFLTPLIFARSTEHIEVYGISMSLFIVSSFISSMIGGVLADIYTRKTVIVISPILVFLTLSASCMIIRAYGLIGYAMIFPLIGFFGSLGSPALNALISETVSRHNIGKAYSFMTALMAAGELVGPVLVTSLLLTKIGLYTIIMTIAILILLTGILRSLVPYIDVKGERLERSLRGVIKATCSIFKRKDVRFILFFSGIIGSAEALYSTFLIPYLRIIVKFSIIELTTIIIFIKIVHIFTQLVSGYIIDKYGPELALKISIMVSFSATLGVSMIPLITEIREVLLIPLGLAALGMIINDPAIKTVIAIKAPDKIKSTLFGIVNNFVVLARSPIVALGSIIWSMSPHLLYFMGSLMFLSSLVFIIHGKIIASNSKSDRLIF